MSNVTPENQEAYDANTDLWPQRTHKNTTFLKIRIALEQSEQFRQSCSILGKTQTQILLAAVTQTIKDARHHAAQQASLEPPQFEMLTIEEARAFLAPYYGGNPPSARTLERRIGDGLLVAVQDHDSRTSPLRILKASLVQWMTRLGRHYDDNYA